MRTLEGDALRCCRLKRSTDEGGRAQYNGNGDREYKRVNVCECDTGARMSAVTNETGHPAQTTKLATG